LSASSSAVRAEQFLSALFFFTVHLTDMAKHIIIGFTGQEASAKSFPVYVGESGVEAAEAMKASNAVRFEVYTGVRGVRKHNPRHDASKPADFVANVLVKAPVDGVDQVDRVDELLTTIQTLKAEKEKDAASLAEMIAANEALQREVSALRTQHHQANELIDDKERATEEMRRNRDEVQERLNHAVARITFLEKELSSAVKAETRNSSTPTTVDESASGPSAGAAGPDASHSSAVDQTPPPGSQGSGSPVSSSSPTTAPQKPAAAPKGMQQQAKGR
jgi:regulator of replication initiation timing